MYIVYRVTVCLFFWSNIIYTWTESQPSTYLVFLTHWGICLLCVTILLETLITLAIFCNASPGRYLMLGELFTNVLSQPVSLASSPQAAGYLSSCSTHWPYSSPSSTGRCCTTTATHPAISTCLCMVYRLVCFQDAFVMLLREVEQ